MTEPQQPTGQGKKPFWLRLSILFSSGLALFLSLMTFPSGLPWMILFWIGVCLFQILIAKRSGILPLAMCFVIVVVKRPDRSPELIVLMAVVLIACGTLIFLYWNSKSLKSKSQSKNFKLDGKPGVGIACVLLAVWSFFAFAYHRHAHPRTVSSFDKNRSILCLGDSLTAAGYPEILASQVNAEVVDMGQDGITTDHGIEKLVKIMKLKPQVVVLELGGHDFNRGEPRTHACENLEHLIQTFQENEIDVILVEVPRGFVSDGYDGMERQLARKYDLELVSDWTIRSFVLMSPICPPGSLLNKKWHRSNDGLHPNKRGNEVFAKSVIDALRNLYGDEIVK